MKSGRASWQEEDDTRKDFSIVLILKEIFLHLRALQGHPGRNLIDILHHRTMSRFRTISWSSFSTSDVQSIYTPTIQDWYREVKSWANDRQYSLCLWIPWIRRQGSWRDRLASTASCTVHAYSMEETSKHCVLGQYQTCSKERTKVLSDAIERHHPLRYTPSLSYPESCSDGNWRNQKRKSVRITSTASEDFLETWLDQGIGFRSCSTSRSQPTNSTKP